MSPVQHLYVYIGIVACTQCYRHFKTEYEKGREKKRKTLTWNLGPLGRLV